MGIPFCYACDQDMRATVSFTFVRRASRLGSSDSSFSQLFDGDFIQLEHNFGIVLDQGEDCFAGTLSPLVTAVKGIFTLLTMSETVVAAHEIVGSFIMQ